MAFRTPLPPGWFYSDELRKASPPTETDPKRSKGMRWIDQGRHLMAIARENVSKEQWYLAAVHATRASNHLTCGACVFFGEIAGADVISIPAESELGRFLLPENGERRIPFKEYSPGATQQDAMDAVAFMEEIYAIVTRDVPEIEEREFFWQKRPDKRYPKVGKCIYCGETNYWSKKPGRRLGAEHIIAEGLGGNLILPEASCKECEDKTSSFEMICLRQVFGPLRIHRGLPSKRPGERPTTIPLEVDVPSKGRGRIVDIPAEIAPVLVSLFAFSPPHILGVTSDEGERQICSIAIPSYGDVINRVDNIKTVLDVHDVAVPCTVGMLPFRRMLAKIAHSYLVAEIGLGSFTPLLLDIILGDDMSHIGQYVGAGSPLDKSKIESGHHLFREEIDLGDGKVYHAVRIRLFREHHIPEYLAIVGTAIKYPHKSE